MNQIDFINKSIDHESINCKINEELDRVINSNTKLEESIDEELIMKVHILRCSECGFESVDRLKFDTHLPCVLKDPPVVYTIYTCCICSTISTSKLIMDEHKQIYHDGEEKTIINEIQDRLKPHLIINESKETDHKKIPHSSNNFQTNTTQMKYMHANLQNALDFSKKISKSIPSHFEFSCRSQNVELTNNNNNNNTSKPLLDCLINNWQKNSID